uniref:Uncharacterized protein n=1 Tax=Amphimedon queenslandica TaxID=400682 RepID=A0A1X7SF35_AMPQE
FTGELVGVLHKRIAEVWLSVANASMSGWIKCITLGATIPYDRRKKGAESRPPKQLELN